MPIEIDPETGEWIVSLDDDAENWMAQHRLEQVRARLDRDVRRVHRHLGPARWRPA